MKQEAGKINSGKISNFEMAAEPTLVPRERISNLVLLLPGLSFLYLIHFSLFGIPTNVLEILIYAFAIAAWVAYPKWRTLHSAEIISLIIVAMVAIIGFVVSPDKHTALGIIKGWVVPLCLSYWMFSRALTEGTVTVMIRGMRAQGIGLAVLGLVQLIPAVATRWSVGVPETSQYLTVHRVVGLFNSPNALAMVLVLSLVASLVLLKRASDLWVVGVIGAAILATGSRGGVVAAILATVLWLLWSAGKKRLSLGVFATTLLLYNPIVLTFVALRHPDNADIRVHIWQKSWGLITSHPIFGIGLTSFHDTFQQFTLHQPNFDEFITPYAVHPHNIFLYTWLLFGLAGLVGLVGLIGIAVRSAYRRKSATAALGAVLLMAFVILGMVDNSLWKNDLVIWFAAALTLAFHSSPNNQT